MAPTGFSVTDWVILVKARDDVESWGWLEALNMGVDFERLKMRQ